MRVQPIAIKLLLITVTAVMPTWCREMFSIDERWICIVKQSCEDCLQLSHCSWCPTEKKCYSKRLPKFEDYCKNNSVSYKDHGFSFKENAECACTDHSDLKEDCISRAEDLECSGRGKCVCGRCICDPEPDLDHPTKMVLGKYCEYDNFSCDGPRCSEGPYSIIPGEESARTLLDNIDTGSVEAVEQPIET